MQEKKIIAVVGMGAILPDAENITAFWNNITSGRYSVTEVPEDRWKTALYYDPDPSVPDKTYSKIGAFVKGYHFDPLKNGIPIPPKVLSVMDNAQQWAIAASHQALKDYGYPEKKLDPERVAVIFGNSNAGESHYRSTFRILLPEYLQALRSVPDFEQLPDQVKTALIEGVKKGIHSSIPAITEDTMPGELSNIISGRVANVFNFSGPNFITDAACASSIAALQAACEGLQDGKFDAALSGGIDRSMGPESYIKFGKIGALSANGSRPYAEGANGFVMGEGAVVFLLKRLEDAERDDDRIYAVIRGIGGSSDGKGKGITAPNPLGQQRAIERAWKDAQIDPAKVALIEGHGTSTKVGDVAEVNSLNTVFGSLGLKNGSVMLGSVKSNIGHLKSAAGAVGLLKTILALHHCVLPPSANFEKPNPEIPFKDLPFRVNTTPREWPKSEGNCRFAGVSAFGFGGTNFHVVLEEYFPGVGGSSSPSFAISVKDTLPETTQQAVFKTMPSAELPGGSPRRADLEQIRQYVLSVVSEKTGYPVEMLDPDLDLEADLGIDTVKQAELFATIRTQYGIARREDLRLSEYNTLSRVVHFVSDSLDAGVVLPTAEIISEGTAKTDVHAGKEASMVNTAEVQPYQGLYFASADTPAELYSILRADLQALASGAVPETRCPSGEALARNERIAVDYANVQELGKRLQKAGDAAQLDNPAVWKALQAHSIYRGSGKPGKIAFLFPGQGSQYVNMLLDLRDTEPVVKDTFDEADRVMAPILGKPLTQFIYTTGGEDDLAQAEKELKKTAVTQPAMLTANVAVIRVLKKYGVEPDLVIGHSLGEYAALVAAGVLTFAEALEVVSTRGREMTKIEAKDPGCMAAVSAPLEKVDEVIRSIDDYVVIANINSPVQCVLGGTTPAIEQALDKFQAEGFQAVKIPVSHAFHTKIVAPASQPLRQVIERMNICRPKLPIVANVTGELYPTGREEILDLLASQVASPVQFVKGMQTLYRQGARIFIEAGPKRVLATLAADNLKDKDDIRIIATNHPRKGGKASFNEALCSIYAAGIPVQKETGLPDILSDRMEPAERVKISALPVMASDGEIPLTGSVVISGAGLGLPGRNKHVFEDANIESILNGDMRIEQLPEVSRRGMLEKHITRLVKSDAGAVMEDITDIDQVLKLAGQSGEFDLAVEFGVSPERVEALDRSTQLAMAAGIEALRDAGIPLVMNYRKTTKGTYLPNGWKLPESMQDETGVIFCSAFPGLNRMVDEADRYYETKILENELQNLKQMAELVYTLFPTGQTQLQNDLQRRIIETENKIRQADYHFDRRYIFRILAMGHSQFAEYIGARGSNTHVNAACSTTTQGVAVAEDWIRTGRCRRVIVIAGDDVTNPAVSPWIGSSLFASGAATAEGDLRMASLPFDRRRNGLIMGMGAAALVIESEDAAKERGVRAIGEILSTVFANSAFHGTQLDVQHVSQVMDRLLSTAEKRFGIDRREIAPETVFVSHETYTPARGGSASAEIHALRSCFGVHANQVVITNTKGYTGHSMGVGIEDVIAVKTLETGKVPPVAHIQDGFEADEELGDLNLSQGGMYNPQYYLRLGAGFGSQIAMTLVRKIPGTGERIDRERYNRWLSAAAGYDHAELEVVQRTLRIKSQGGPAAEPARPVWKYGQAPRFWAAQNEVNEDIHFTGKTENCEALSDLSPVIKVETQKISPAASPAAAEVNAYPANSALEEVKQYVLSVVSEKTGYPSEMLDLDLDLEADLGIDTVKQAELFAAIRTHYEIPRREDLRLSEYNTLTKVIRFIQDGIAAKASVKPAEVAETISKPDAEPEKSVEKAKILRRVPVPALLPRLDLCQPTGVCLEGSRVVIVEGKTQTDSALVKQLNLPGVEVIRISLSDTSRKLQEITQSGKVSGLYFLPCLDDDPEWSAKTDGEYRSAKDALVQALYHAACILPREAFILAATRMGGWHGFIEPANPLGGLVSGFLKALHRERPDQLIKIIDFEKQAEPDFVAEQLVSETLNDPLSVEIGREGRLRYGIVIRPETQASPEIKPLREGSVFVVSGGTGGITGAIVKDLAKATRGTFYMLGRSKVDAENTEFVSYQKDPAAFRSDLQARMIAGGEKFTPVQMEQRITALQRSADTCRVMREVEDYGGKAVYLQCDVTDAAAVKTTVERIACAEKRVDVFVHAAGADWSRKIENKTLDEVKQVISVKADGFLNIFRALENVNLLPDRTVFFSSVAGRFGNSGQTDYSAANDLLSKYALYLPAKDPQMQVLSIDWGAWAEVGMASRGHIPALMKMAGIEMMQPREAARMLRHELEMGTCGEVVISGSLGVLERSADENAVMDLAKGDQALRAGTPIHQMLSHLAGYDPQTGVRLEAEMDPKELAYLRDHSINSIPVLPGVAGIEGFSVAAKHIASVLASDDPGFEVESLEDIRFLAPFKFYGNKSRLLTWHGFPFRTLRGLVIQVSLESDYKRWNGQVDHIVHFTGLVHLTQETPAAAASAKPPRWGRQKSVSSDEIYKLYFHGPSFQVLEAAQSSENVVLGRLSRQLAGIHADDPVLLSAPMLVELCFQTAGLWEVGTTGTMALPQSVGALKVYRQPVNGAVIYAEVKPGSHDGQVSFDARVVDAKGNLYLEITNYRTSPLPNPAEKALSEPMKVLVMADHSEPGE